MSPFKDKVLPAEDETELLKRWAGNSRFEKCSPKAACRQAGSTPGGMAAPREMKSSNSEDESKNRLKTNGGFSHRPTIGITAAKKTERSLRGVFRQKEKKRASNQTRNGTKRENMEQ